MSEIKVLAVDDSILFRELLSKGMKRFSDIKVVGVASDPFDAKDKILSLRPDVMTLDVEMPCMDGIKFLRNLMPQYPLPVVIISSLRESVFEAMDAGAVDFIPKPGNMSKDGDDFINEIAAKIRLAATAKPAFRRSAQVDIKLAAMGLRATPDPLDIVTIGASTGGTEAIYSILTKYGANMPGFVIVQHMPEGFTKLFAARLDSATSLEVKEAEDGDDIRPGRALVAPGGMQTRVRRTAHGYAVSVAEGAKVNGHSPSVDVLFESVAEAAGSHAIGVILTGMGTDGALGLKMISDAGGYTIGQDERSSVVYGMPMAAFLTGGVKTQLPLYRIADEIIRKLES
ncbi:MAG: chemotaxis response regulator protein-glutamate methylesterase [Clostridiales Family XIII bacterium]|jgi:two-component system chemotaxis response regulator CheB|nr:chemotaxis response regulator protein-glutamate methylesterase [Clostridiales Family XIII bacterium]